MNILMLLCYWFDNTLFFAGDFYDFLLGAFIVDAAIIALIPWGRR